MSRSPPLLRLPRRLLLALLASLGIHAILLLPPASRPHPPPPPAPPLQARLQPPPAPAASVPELRVANEQATARNAREIHNALPRPARDIRPTPPERGKGAAHDWREQVQKHLQQLQQQGLFYPPEAIARNEQGEVVVLLLLAEDGQVAAARVEQGSGYPLLDAAALRAVRSLNALPADAPRQTLLPVRFRLR